jgi:hypothetical protein
MDGSYGIMGNMGLGRIKTRYLTLLHCGETIGTSPPLVFMGASLLYYEDEEKCID